MKLADVATWSFECGGKKKITLVGFNFFLKTERGDKFRKVF